MKNDNLTDNDSNRNRCHFYHMENKNLSMSICPHRFFTGLTIYNSLIIFKSFMMYSEKKC